MAEVAQSISTATPSSVVSREPPKHVLPKQDYPDAPAASAMPKPPTKRQHQELLTLAALGATFGFLTGWGLWTEIHFDSVEFVLLVVVLALAGYVFIDPLSELIKEGGEEGGETGSGQCTERRGVAAGVFGAAGVLAVAAIDHSLTSALGDSLKKLAEELEGSKQDLLALHTIAPDIKRAAEWVLHIGAFWTALIMLGLVGLSSLLVTHFWAHGARRHPVRSALFGAAIGLGLGVCGASSLIYYLVERGLFHGWPSWTLASLVALWFVFPGFSGGWAIHKLEDKPSPTREIAWYLVISSAVYIVPVLLLARWFQSSSPYKDSINGLIWLPVSALLFQNLGWALVPYFRRRNCDPCLRPLGKVAEQLSPEPARPALLPMLIEMPRRDGVVLPLVTPTDQHQAPKEMILKPRGDRLWATAALVLALVIATPAYLLGTLRNDRSIANNIETNLQKDSGLRTKGLTVHSTGRVVIISGAVSNETERAEAIQRALSVRGVKQLIDQIQVVPPQPPSPPIPANIVPAPEMPQPESAAPSISATISIGGSPGSGAAGSGKASTAATPNPASSKKPVPTGKAAGPQKLPATAGSQKLAEPQKQAEATKPADSQKHKGLLGFLKKGKENLSGSPTDAHKTDAQKPGETPKSADTQKHGVFNFLKKDKDKNKENNNAKPRKNETKSKKNNTKDPTTH